MQVKATSKHIRISPYKLRPIVDVVRGNRVDKAIAWLKTSPVKKSIPVLKTIQSAFANAKNNYPSEAPAQMEDFIVKEIRVDGGPIIKYFKPGAMGRASMQRRRLSHLQVVVERKK